MESGAHNEERKGRGKEGEASTHIIGISRLTHAALVTKIGITERYVAKKSK